MRCSDFGESLSPCRQERAFEGPSEAWVDVLNDPYSSYMTEEEAAAHQESLSDERVGIGAEIAESRGRFIIVAPVRNSPAEKAGILPYDEIVRYP